ncbi:hypothetical protein, partial [Erwinia sp.]|uniref:hypothetical protein n=1 Tax=Erwinia citreus TaxID=558 RepID=UPI0028A2203F
GSFCPSIPAIYILNAFPVKYSAVCKVRIISLLSISPVAIFASLWSSLLAALSKRALAEKYSKPMPHNQLRRVSPPRSAALLMQAIAFTPQSFTQRKCPQLLVG